MNQEKTVFIRTIQYKKIWELRSINCMVLKRHTNSFRTLFAYFCLQYKYYYHFLFEFMIES